MKRGTAIRRSLAWAVVAVLLLPVVLSIVLGLGGLLAALGDGAGAAVCRRAGLVVAVFWMTALVGTVAGTAVAQLSQPPHHGRRPVRHRRRRRQTRRSRLGLGIPAAESEPRDRPA